MKNYTAILTLILAAACGNPPEPTQTQTPDTFTKTDVKAGLCVLVYPFTGSEFRAGFAADSVEPMTGCMYFVASSDVTVFSEGAEVIATESCVSIWELAGSTDAPCVLNTVPQ